MPVKCYLDSGLRHFFKAVAGITDEPHYRGAVWNFLCAMWTATNKPEMMADLMVIEISPKASNTHDATEASSGIKIESKVQKVFQEFLKEKKIPEDKIPSTDWEELLLNISHVKVADGNDLDNLNRIIVLFERLLEENGIDIPNDEREDDDEDAALIYGEDYYFLEDELKEIFST